MTRRVTLDLSLDQFDGLHRQLDKARSTSRTVTVDRQSLASLLVDHSRLLKLLQVEEADKAPPPPPLPSRPLKKGT